MRSSEQGRGAAGGHIGAGRRRGRPLDQPQDPRLEGLLGQLQRQRQQRGDGLSLNRVNACSVQMAGWAALIPQLSRVQPWPRLTSQPHSIEHAAEI